MGTPIYRGMGLQDNLGDCRLAFWGRGFVDWCFWAVYRHNIQNAFAVASYVVALAAVSVGTVQTVLVMQ